MLSKLQSQPAVEESPGLLLESEDLCIQTSLQYIQRLHVD